MTMTRDSINVWLEHNDKQMEKAAEVLAGILLTQFVCEKKELKDDKVLLNATDLQECDYDDLDEFYSLLQQKWESSIDSWRRVIDKLEVHPFSIKTWNEKERGYGSIAMVFDKWCNENAESNLPDELLDAVHQRYDVACIVNAKSLGGGGYEMMQDLYRQAKEKLTETIKRELKH